MTRVLALATAVLAAAFLGAGGGGAASTQNPKLHARVGPGFSIGLTDGSGARVTQLDPGTYDIEVEDEGAEHSFHLRGPGVDRRTGIEATGKELWTVTFADGTYSFFCDEHPTTMQGSFTVGNPPATTTPPPAAITPKTRLVLTSGPGFRITLTTGAGKAFKSMRRGTYTIVVRDRSAIHNAHVVAPGFNRRTAVPFVGTQRWKARLAKAGTLRFLCDPHASQGMRGSKKIV
jgi:plastocyanin